MKDDMTAAKSVAIVTGAGIGRATALRLSRDFYALDGGEIKSI